MGARMGAEPRALLAQRSRLLPARSPSRRRLASQGPHGALVRGQRDEPARRPGRARDRAQYPRRHRPARSRECATPKRSRSAGNRAILAACDLRARPPGTVHVWNRECERMFGWSANEVVGGATPFTSEDLRLDAAVEQAFSGLTVTGCEGRVRRADDTAVDMTSRSRRCATTGGRVVTAVVVAADVTEQKRAARRSRRAKSGSARLSSTRATCSPSSTPMATCCT